MSSDVMENAKAAGRGGAMIFFSNIVSTLIAAVGAIIVIRLLSPTEYGLYTIAGIPASMLLLFGDWGLNSALTKFIAQYRAEGKEQNIVSILQCGLVLKLGFGIILTFLTFLLSDFLAVYVLQKPEASLLVKVSCLMVLGTQLYNTSWSTFLGFETMKYNAFMQVLFTILKALLAPLLVFLGFGALGAVAGLSLGILAAGLVGILIIFFALYRSLRKTRSEGSMGFMETMRMMLGYGFPLAVIGIIGGFGGQLYSFLMARYSSTFSVGNYGVASTFLVFVGFITFPVSNVLFPVFSKMSGSEGREGLEVAFRASVRYVSFLMLPAAVGVMAVSQPLIGVLFGGEYSLAPLFLILLSVGSLFCGLGSLSMGSLLSSQGETWTVFRIGLLTMVVGLPLSFILIPRFGVLGFIVNGLITQAVSTILYIFSVRRLFKFKMWVGQSVRTYVAAFTMGGLVWVTLIVLRLWVGIYNDIILLGAGCLVGFFSYLLLLPLIGAIERADLESLNDVFGMFGRLKPIFGILFVIMMRVVAIRSREGR